MSEDQRKLSEVVGGWIFPGALESCMVTPFSCRWRTTNVFELENKL